MVLEKVDDLRYGENPHQRAAFYRETTHRSGDARRRDPAPGRHAVVQQPARPRRRVPDRPRLHGADGRDRQAHRPGRARLARRARRGLPARARDRPGRVVRRRSSASTASSTARRRARSRRTRTRRSSRPGFSQVGARHPARQARPRAARRSRPTRPRGCATTASPASTSSASPAACSSRAWTSSASIAASSRS